MLYKTSNGHRMLTHWIGASIGFCYQRVMMATGQPPTLAVWNVYIITFNIVAQKLCLLGQTKQGSEAFASAQAIESATDGFGIWALTATFCGLVLIATTFISHTVGAIVILPIVGAVGAEMQVGPCWRLLIRLPSTPSHAS